MLRRYLGLGVVLLLQIFGFMFIRAPDWDTALAQAPVQTFTLTEGINYALNNNREFQVAEKDVELAAEKVKEARGALLPQLTLDTGYTFNGDLPTTVLSGNFPPGLGGPPSQDGSAGETANGTPSEPIELQFGAAHNFRGQAQVRYPLFTWGQLGNLYRQAVLGEQVAEKALEAVRLDIELQVRQAFHGLLLADAFVEVIEQALAQVEKRYQLAEKQKTAGITTRLEVIRANVQVVNTRSQLIQARNQQKLAIENLKLTLGLPLDQRISIQGQLHPEIKEVTLERAIATALAKRPEIQQLDIQEQIGEKQVKVARAGNKPMLSTFGNYTFNDSERQSLDTSWSVGLAIQIPIFDGFATRAQVKQAHLRLDQVRTNKDQLLDGIKLQVKSAVFDLQAAEKLIEAQVGIIEQAAEGLRIANVQYEAGLIIGVELTDVELSHTQAHVNRLQAIHDYIIAVARLERAIGSRLE